MGKADEIFNKIPHLGRDGHYFHISKTSVIGAMEEYAKDLKQSRDTWEHISQELRADLELKVNQILRIKNLIDAFNDEAINLFDQSHVLSGNNKAETLIKADTMAKMIDDLNNVFDNSANFNTKANVAKEVIDQVKIMLIAIKNLDLRVYPNSDTTPHYFDIIANKIKEYDQI